MNFLASLFVTVRRGLAPVLALSLFAGCGAGSRMTDADRLRAEYCEPTIASHEFVETPFHGGKPANILSFTEIRSRINISCNSCHRYPAKTNGFSYFDDYKGQQLADDQTGKLGYVPGLSETAEKMREYILNPAQEKSRMPPADHRKDPEAALQLGRDIGSWIQAGKPQGTFEVGKVAEERTGKLRPEVPHSTTDLGDCVPKAKAAGFDAKADYFFENAKELPRYLSDTDLTTLDPFELAQHGTFAYNVEYPLWADNADKGRWIHVPMKIENGQLVKQPVDFDAVKGQFRIPRNTRFYKTFYKPVKLPNGQTRMRRMETRLIVAREPFADALMGTYQWDEAEQVATLVTASYRDGTPWRDVKFDVVVNETTLETRPYAIPGRTRCIDCHMGSPMGNAVLGFIPLQINRRPLGGAGRLELVRESDLTQVRRLISYAVLGGLTSEAELPVLEQAGVQPARNDHELRVSGYVIGNCMHCHNPEGYAIKSGNGIELMFTPGALFGFNTEKSAVTFSGRKLVDFMGGLDTSHIWHKLTDPPESFGIYSRMPMHTAATPDCRALTYFGKWIRSFESLAAAAEFDPKCSKKENPNDWIELDLTWPETDHYTPRRADWQDLKGGMPQRYRDLVMSPAMTEAIKTKFPIGYWTEKPSCSFPAVDIPAEKRLPWMMDGDKPYKPFGQVYFTTPGSYFYQNTCIRCHGPKADGKSSLATNIAVWSKGDVRVANFMKDMFGNGLENLKTFDIDGKNYAGNYLIWMASEGTRVQFPPQLSVIVGSHGGRMLNVIRERCLDQIRPNGASDWDEDYFLFNTMCFMDNLQPGAEELRYAGEKPVHPEAVEAWADRAASNAGWAVFDYLKNAAQGTWPPRLDQCELEFGGK